MTMPRSPWLVAPFLLGIALPGQQDTPTTSPPDVLQSIRSGKAILSADAGRLWGLGDGYRLELTDEYIEFTPAFGARAPRNFPVRFRLDAIRRGATSVLADPMRSAPARDGTRAIYAFRSPEHGTVQERWDVRPEGAELSYVLPQPVDGDGDLVVSLQLDTELTATEGDGHQSLVFGGVPYGDVTIGAVTAIDARGQRSPGSLRWHDNRLDLIVPGHFVDDAAWPLVIDPLIGGVTSAGISFDDYVPDVAYDLASDTWTATFEFRMSAADTDVWTQLIRGSDGQRIPNGGSIGVGPGHQQDAAIANVRMTGRNFVVWQSDARGDWDIEAREIDPLTGTLSPVIQVANTIRDEIAPDIAGDAGTTEAEALVVYQDVGGIGFRGCQVAGGANPNAFGFVDIPAPMQDKNIEISKSGGATGRYLLAWETSNATDFFLALRACDRNLALDPLTTRIPGLGSELFSADVDGDGQDCLVVYSRRESGSMGDSDIHGAYVDIRSPAALPASTFTIDATPAHDETFPSTAWMGGDYFTVVWSERISGTTRRQIHGVNFLRGNALPCGREFQVSSGSNNTTGLTNIGSKAASGASSDEAVFVWEIVDTSNGNALCMYTRCEATGNGGAVRDLGGGCGLGGTAAASGGPFAFGNTAFGIDLTGANGGAATQGIVLLAVGSNPATVPCGSCVLLLPIVSLAVPIDGSGNGRFPLPVLCDAGLFGGVVQAQFLVLTPGTMPCNLAAVSLSNRLSMTIGD